MVTQKRCTKCLTSRPLSDFARRSASRDGLQYQCRSCQTAWAQENPDQARTKVWRLRARRAGVAIVPFTVAQLQQRLALYGGRCWMCRELATEVDHVKPFAMGGGHMLANIRPICRGCNAAKGARWPLVASC